MLNMTNRRKPKRYEPILFLMMLLASALCSACQEQIIYHSFRSIPLEGWLRTDTVCFEVEVADSQTQVCLNLDIRHRNTYPYQNILLQLSQETPEGKVTHTDTLNLKLANSQGIWTGKGWGGLYQSPFRLHCMEIEKAGTYRFKVYQLMPTDTLPGLNDIGLLLEKAPSH